MKSKEEVLRYLKEKGQQVEIPDSIAPDQMCKKIKQHEAQKAFESKRKGLKRFGKMLPAACICIVLGMSALFWHRMTAKEITQAEISSDDTVVLEAAGAQAMTYPEVTYEDIYASMKQAWEEESVWFTGGKLVFNEMADGAEAGKSRLESVEGLKSELSAAEDSAVVGTTNVQTEGVDEGDIVKNDGRYLYQKIWEKSEGGEKQVIQIIDTGEGLTEAARVADFDSIEEFYVWEDVLVVIESKYLNEYSDDFQSSEKGILECEDTACYKNGYHEISFYDLTDRSRPEKIRTFTLQGSYASSRIADGYFYGFSRYYANPGEGEQDYDSYVPKLDGSRLEASRIYLPEESAGTSYLVLVSVDLRDPTEFVQTMGIVSEGEMYYVSADSIYVADTKAAEMKEGWTEDSTSLIRFSYGEGNFILRAKGEIKGRLDSSFSMDEYDDHLRVVTTVREYKMNIVTDDRTEKTIGSEITDERQTNALYVLDGELKVVGKLEGLAEDEQIYSSRFMGKTGYFVTFRQTDPLFTVDLTDPTNPKVLSELKVSGFSEYLHVYGEGRLLGIGMEADEETGRQEGMKLSMFDISDGANVQEVSRLSLEKYNYSEALYNHRAALISPAKNVIGFEAVGSSSGEYWKEYLVFAYENDAFVQKLKLPAKDAENCYYSTRGTFIGDVFYLLSEDGSVQSYDLNTGEQLESLEP